MKGGSMIGVNRRRVMGGRPKDYLAFEALNDGTFTPPQDMEYSLNGYRFEAIAGGVASPVVKAGKKIYWRGNLDGGTEGIGSFGSSGVRFNVMGNILSLCYGDAFEDETTLRGAIGNSLLMRLNVVDASRLVLPSGELVGSCYFYMFFDCKHLVNAPELPATSLANDCYRYMFNGCTSLVTAPELPATILATNCYQNMFSGCTSLTTAPDLPATKLAKNCYSNMFIGCTSLVTAPELPATILDTKCYRFMFSSCTSLTTAPDLPATSLANDCYQYMFSGCTSLGYIKAMFVGAPGTNIRGWVHGVSSTGTFVKNRAATWDVVGEDGVPEGWTIEYADE